MNSTESVRAYTALLDSKLNEEFPDYGDAPDIDTETVAEYSQALLSNIQGQVAPLSLPEVTGSSFERRLSFSASTLAASMTPRAEGNFTFGFPSSCFIYISLSCSVLNSHKWHHAKTLGDPGDNRGDAPESGV